MRFESYLVLLVGSLFYLVRQSDSAPGRTNNEVLIGEVDLKVDKFLATTEESFMTKCIVDGNSYSHSQTIPSNDQSLHCLCVAGEVYCWWQSYYQDSNDLAVASSVPWTTEENYSLMQEGSTDSSDTFEASGEASGEEDISEENTRPLESNSTNISSSTTVSANCVIMGREYRPGELLPHTTGNCVECRCSSGGKIECSPRDCVSLRSQIAPDIPGLVDGDFEVFNLDRDRGIDGNF